MGKPALLSHVAPESPKAAAAPRLSSHGVRRHQIRVQDSARVGKRHSRGLMEENQMAISMRQTKQRHLGMQRKGKQLLLLVHTWAALRGPRDVRVTD